MAKVFAEENVIALGQYGLSSFKVKLGELKAETFIS